MSVCKETTGDPIGNLIEGIFECIDQYESEVNEMPTSLAMMEAIRQGIFRAHGLPTGFVESRSRFGPALLGGRSSTKTRKLRPFACCSGYTSPAAVRRASRSS